MPKRKKKQITKYAHEVLSGELAERKRDMATELGDFKRKMDKKKADLQETVHVMNSGPGGIEITEK